jgi:uncharacterized protein YndB with AHSA1/START domain
MKWMVLILIGLVVLLVAAAAVFYVAGSRLPREHRSIVVATLRANRTTVWAALTDYAAIPQWWPAVKSVRLEKSPDGTEVTWNLDAHNKSVPFRTVESRPNEKLVRAIASDKLPFGGTWTYDLADADGGTRLTLTEDGVINPPIFRAIANWFYGLDTTQRDYLAHLEKHLATPTAK